MKKQLAFLDLLLEFGEQHPEFTDEEIQQEVHTFISAGHDTTASGISFTLYTLGRHPHIQVRIGVRHAKDIQQDLNLGLIS